MAKESQFQSDLKTEIQQRFPGAVIMKQNAKLYQGVPDYLVLWKKHWALLECKKEENAPHRPNQDKKVEMFNNMSFSSFIFPENKEEVLDAMERSFKA